MTLEDINIKYQLLASQLGDHHYKIKQHKEAVAALEVQIDELNKLAQIINQKETKAIAAKEAEEAIATKEAEKAKKE